MNEKTLAEHIANPLENIKYAGLELLSQNYDPIKLIREVEKRNALPQLKYLSAVAAEAAKLKGYASKNIECLLTAIDLPQTKAWTHLEPNVDPLAKKFVENLPKTERENSYKVHSTLTSEELADWIDLYLTGKHLNA